MNSLKVARRPKNARANRPVSCETIAIAFLGPPQRRARSEYFWNCPNHEDARASLKINVRKNCFYCGPCDQKGNYWRLASFFARLDPVRDKAKVGAWLREHNLIHKRPALISGQPERVAEYYYGDNLRTVRREFPTQNGAKPEKLFHWEHKRGETWFAGDGGLAKPLYTNALFRTRDQFSRAIGTEGEGKADLAGELGFPGFSFKSVTVEQCNVLADLEVVLWPDRDKSGFEQVNHAAKVILESKTARGVRIVSDLDGLVLKEDLIDGVKRLGWDAAEVERRIASAAPYPAETPEPRTRPKPAPKTRPKRRQTGANSVRCAREWRETRPEEFRLDDDGRKWLHKCKERRALAMQLATYADPDGSSITVSVATLMKHLGMSHATAHRFLADLARLKMLESKKRGIQLTSLRALKLPASDVSDSPGDVSSSDGELQE